MSKNPKKYAFIGTSCAGKTTIIEELKKILPQKFPQKRIAFIPEAARIYFTETKNITNRFSYEHQRNIMLLAQRLESNIHKQTSLIICDRSILDAPSYLAAMRNVLYAKKLLQEFQEWIPTYSHFFILDPEDIPYIKDSVRTESKKTRTQFHNSFLKIVPTVTKRYSLLKGNSSERIDKVLSVMYSNTL